MLVFFALLLGGCSLLLLVVADDAFHRANCKGRTLLDTSYNRLPERWDKGPWRVLLRWLSGLSRCKDGTQRLTWHAGRNRQPLAELSCRLTVLDANLAEHRTKSLRVSRLLNHCILRSRSLVGRREFPRDCSIAPADGQRGHRSGARCRVAWVACQQRWPPKRTQNFLSHGFSETAEIKHFLGVFRPKYVTRNRYLFLLIQ